MARYRFGTGAKPCSNAVHRAASYQTTLERRFPHIMTAIQAMWGYPELNTYFHKLTIDERGHRQGFPPDVWDDIHLLWSLHQTIVPQSLPTIVPRTSCV